MIQSTQQSNLPSRPPVVVILGHVDHGKTTLLDYLRKTNLAAREAGGITQAVSAYEIEHAGRKLTFIDTPGHKAFTGMRSRGARLADLAILLVAADDGVKPQTEESIRLLKESKIPFIVALNKIDKNNANPERAKQDLLSHEVLLEGFGGNVSWQEVSAKTGAGVNELLDLLVLAADLEGFTYDPAAPARGFILESRLSKQRGIEVVVIIKDGTLRRGEFIRASSAVGKIKLLEDFTGRAVDSLLPSAPAVVIGFDSLPAVGEEFSAGSLTLASTPDTEIVVRPDTAPAPAATHILNVILKADTAGSLEALTHTLDAIPSFLNHNAAVYIVDRGLGEISDGDVKNALTASAFIIGFNVKVSKPADNLARAHRVSIITSKIIYELVKALEDELSRRLTPVTARNSLKVLAVFSASGSKQTIGGRVEEGIIKKGQTVEIRRGEDAIGRGKIINLQCEKADVHQVETGRECGLVIDLNSGDIVAGDQLLVVS